MSDDNFHGCEAALSGCGVDIFGDRQSIDRVREWMHSAGTVPALRERLVEEHAIVDRVWKALGISTYEEAGGLSVSEIVERQRAALLNLANAADSVGVRFFDTDTMEPEVFEMQQATQAARAVIADQKP